MTESSKKAIGYARVSTKRQSLDLQIMAIQEYAHSNGYEIEIFSEAASGKGLLHKYVPSVFAINRPALWGAINKAKQENLPLIVLNLDRLSRAVKDGMWIYAELPKIISINEGEVSLDKAYEIFSQAEAEREKNSQRTKTILAEARKRIPLKRQDKYKQHFFNEGCAEYVLEYVLGERSHDVRTMHSPCQDGDLQSCIMTAWGDICPLDYSNPTIEECTHIAELALDYIARDKTRKDCSLECPTEGWVFDDELKYQVEIPN